MNDWWTCPRCEGKGTVEGARCGLCLGMGELSQEDWEQHWKDLYWKFLNSMGEHQAFINTPLSEVIRGHNR